MRQLSSLLQGLARSMAGKERKEDDPQGTVLRSSGTLRGEGSETLAAVWSRRGEKGTNQDCSLVWEGFGCQDDTIFCGIFDGHGQWGHYVSKAVRDSLPPSLLRHWQEAVALASLIDGEKKLGDCQFDLWRQSYLAAAAAVDEELRRSRRLDAVNSGSTALSIVKKGDTMVIANVGDSRAVLGTTSDDGSIAAVQLTVDFKPNLPQEKARIVQCKGRVHCHDDEPGVHRVWLPDREAPGLAMSRAFGDYCVKDYGVISAPEVTQRRITSRDQFVILATDGVSDKFFLSMVVVGIVLLHHLMDVGKWWQVWDVVSNEEAVQIVADTPEREKAAKRLVQCAVRAWRRKRRGYAVDDCSAICLFLHPPPS
ncbi:probable protein phosphatase 2C 48 isoform X2 [Triticum aestivum]|uniref:probable protein phosphatase 2C 48 isoform X2 n=1 Tax=Triticum aestivum TaxID=4565 RepID=UPI001D0134B1|nr:probable protein phosphatase 2C 48 isoform X2 [Triticum aestivum]